METPPSCPIRTYLDRNQNRVCHEHGSKILKSRSSTTSIYILQCFLRTSDEQLYGLIIAPCSLANVILCSPLELKIANDVVRIWTWVMHTERMLLMLGAKELSYNFEVQ